MHTMGLFLGSKEPLKVFNREATSSDEKRMDGQDARLVAPREERGLKRCAGRAGATAEAPGGKGVDLRGVEGMEWPDGETTRRMGDG